MYVLERDDSKPGPSPYVLDATAGDMPRSSIELLVQLKHTTSSSTSSNTKPPPPPPMALTLNNYLAVPPPRTTRTALIGHMLATQYPDKIKSADDIESILFLPFVEGGIVKGRTTSGGCGSDADDHDDASDERHHHQQQQQQQQEQSSNGCLPETDTRNQSSFGSLSSPYSGQEQRNKSESTLDVEDEIEVDDNMSLSRNISRFAKPEISLRFPCYEIPPDLNESNPNYSSPRLLSSPSMDVHAKRLRFFEHEHETFDSTNVVPDDSKNNKKKDKDFTTIVDTSNTGNRKKSHEAPLLLPERSFRFPILQFPCLGCFGKSSATVSSSD